MAEGSVQVALESSIAVPAVTPRLITVAAPAHAMTNDTDDGGA